MTNPISGSRGSADRDLAGLLDRGLPPDTVTVTGHEQHGEPHRFRKRRRPEVRPGRRGQPPALGAGAMATTASKTSPATRAPATTEPATEPTPVAPKGPGW